jgi:hypothetical protein
MCAGGCLRSPMKAGGPTRCQWSATKRAGSSGGNTAALAVPKDAAVVFDLVYRVGGREFTDDNQGRWYLAD